MIRVQLDKRITISQLKDLLAPFIDVPTDLFKMYRVFSNNQVHLHSLTAVMSHHFIVR